MGCKKNADCGVDAEQKKILTALNDLGKPVAPKMVAEETGLESKTVSAKMKGLKAKGMVDSPVRCKWAITDSGKSEIGK